MVLRVADGEVPAELLLQAGVHALLRRGGGEVEGEQEQQVGQVGQTHPHLRHPAPPPWSLPTSHISQPVQITLVVVVSAVRQCCLCMFCSSARFSTPSPLHRPAAAAAVTKAGRREREREGGGRSAQSRPASLGSHSSSASSPSSSSSSS